MTRVDSREVRDAEAWVAASVPIGGLTLVQTEPWASVYRATAVNGEIVWFKACAPHQAFEVPLTASLSARWPTTVTEVLAHDVERRWLLVADAGETLRKLGNPPERWLAVLPAYARLQAGERDRVANHLDAGVPDLRLTKFPERYDDLLAAELPLEPDERATLAAFRPRFGALCTELDRHGIESTVQHDDLHMNNVFVKDDALRVLDWGDASISPLLLPVRDLPVPDRDEPPRPGPSVVRAPPRCIPRTVGTRSRRGVRSRATHRGFGTLDRLARPARGTPGSRSTRVRRWVRRDVTDRAQNGGRIYVMSVLFRSRQFP